MVIREVGILFRGFTLISVSYHEVAGNTIDQDLRSSLLTALLNFAESVFSSNAIEYFQMNKFIICFIKDQIISSDSPEPELLMYYVILDKQKRIDKFIRKIIQPILKQVCSEFKNRYNKKNLSEISQFKDFKQILDTCFDSHSKTIEQRMWGTLFD